MNFNIAKSINQIEHIQPLIFNLIQSIMSLSNRISMVRFGVKPLISPPDTYEKHLSIFNLILMNRDSLDDANDIFVTRSVALVSYDINPYYNRIVFMKI